MENKEEFLQKLTLLFWKHGAKTLTMDDIAKEFSISKKTLYQQYQNKDEILKEVLNFTLTHVVNQIEKSKSLYDNPIESLLNSHGSMEVFMQEGKNIFTIQMNKYYSDLMEQHKKDVYLAIRDIFSSNIKKGRAKGLYRENFNEDLYFKFVLQLFFSVEISPLFELERQQHGIMCLGIFDFYFNSILTEQGLENYKEIIKKYEKLD